MSKSKRVQDLDDFVNVAEPYNANKRAQEIYEAKVRDIYKDDDLDLDTLDDENVTDIIVQKYKEDITEILSQAYNDVSGKIDQIVEALQPGK